jgi:hypothetical protein
MLERTKSVTDIKERRSKKTKKEPSYVNTKLKRKEKKGRRFREPLRSLNTQAN